MLRNEVKSNHRKKNKYMKNETLIIKIHTNKCVESVARELSVEG